MKFDPKKPYGLITNHAWARYEQDGILYDCQGNPMDQINEQVVIEEPVVETIEQNFIVKKDFALKNAEDFLSNILADGPLPRSTVFKETSSNNQNWDKVKTAFAEMGGETLQRKNVLYWKLKTT